MAQERTSRGPTGLFPWKSGSKTIERRGIPRRPKQLDVGTVDFKDERGGPRKEQSVYKSQTIGLGNSVSLEGVKQKAPCKAS